MSAIKKFCLEDQGKQTWLYKLIYTCIQCIYGQIMRIWGARKTRGASTHTYIYIYIQYININTDIKIYVYMVAPPPQSYFEKRMGRLFHLSSPDTVQKHGKYHFLWNMMRHSLSLRSSVPSFVHRKTKHVTKNIQKRKARIRFSIFTSGKQCWTPCARNPEVHHQNNRETKKLACVPLHWLRAPPISEAQLVTTHVRKPLKQYSVAV